MTLSIKTLWGMHKQENPLPFILFCLKKAMVSRAAGLEYVLIFLNVSKSAYGYDSKQGHNRLQKAVNIKVTRLILNYRVDSKTGREERACISYTQF